jgi:hypothetical protein
MESEERRLLDAFVASAKEMPEVGANWAAAEPSADMTVVVSEHDPLDELRLHAMFQKLSASSSQPVSGDLTIVAEPYEPGGGDSPTRPPGCART